MFAPAALRVFELAYIVVVVAMPIVMSPDRNRNELVRDVASLPLAACAAAQTCVSGERVGHPSSVAA